VHTYNTRDDKKTQIGCKVTTYILHIQFMTKKTSKKCIFYNKTLQKRQFVPFLNIL